MSQITCRLFDTFLPIVFTLNVLLGRNTEWKLVSEDNDMAFYVNYISLVMARTLLAMTFCIASRLVLSKRVGTGNYFSVISIATDIVSFIAARILPTSFVLAIIVLLSYAVIGLRFIYDVIITGHGLIWIFRNTEFFIKSYEIEKEENLELQCSYSDSNILHLYRRI